MMGRRGFYPERAKRVEGFTLTEVLVAVTIVGILSATAVVNYGTAVQRSRWDAARTMLLQIYDGEWKFLNTVSPTGNAFFQPTAGNAQGTQCPNPGCVTDWRNNLFLDPPNGVTGGASAPQIWYSVTVTAGPPPTFTATAFLGSAAGATTQTIDQNKQFCAGGACTWTRP